MMGVKQLTCLTWASTLVLSLSNVAAADPSSPPASPSPSAATSNPDERWKQSEFYRNGQKAYAEKNYMEAFKWLVLFRAANQELFSRPPKDLEPLVKEILEAINYSETKLAPKAVARPAAPKDTAPPDNKRDWKDGIRGGGNPGVYDKEGNDKGHVYGAHERGPKDREHEAAGRDKAAADKGASARERP